LAPVARFRYPSTIPRCGVSQLADIGRRPLGIVVDVAGCAVVVGAAMAGAAKPIVHPTMAANVAICRFLIMY
jgi:hypothetical protein